MQEMREEKEQTESRPAATRKPFLVASIAALAVAAVVGGVFLSGGGSQVAPATAPQVAQNTAPQEVESSPPKAPATESSPQPAPVQPQASTSAPSMPAPKVKSGPGGGLSLPEIAGIVVGIPPASVPMPPATSEAKPETQNPEPVSPEAPTPVAKPAPGSDPFPNIMTLIELGGRDNLVQAERSLRRISSNSEGHSDHRGKAAFMLGRMNDPKYHNPSVSPHAKANPAGAHAYYELAASLGIKGLDGDIQRLGGK